MLKKYIDLKGTLESLQQDLINTSSESTTILSDDIPSTDISESTQGKDLLITHAMVNHLHGEGVLLSRLFDPKTCINIVTHRDFDSEKGPFKTYWIKATGQSRAAIFSLVLEVVAKENIRRILCVPYYREDHQISIAAKHILNVPLVAWVMDRFHGTDIEIGAELFSLADIRFVISPEMRDAYETKFRKKFYVLPPPVKATWIGSSPQSDISQNLTKKICVMIGNIWGRPTLENLFRIIKKSGWTVHWYGTTSATPWLNTSPQELLEYGIVDKGYLPQEELIKVISTYPFTLVPSGSGDKEDNSREITLFSFPSRISFLLATTYIPILVIGGEKSCAVKFVRRFGVGLTTDYNEQAFLKALGKMSNREFLAQCSERAAKNAKIFSDEGLMEWIWKSGEKGSVVDDRFERAFQKQRGSLTCYREESAPHDLDEKFQASYLSLRRLAQNGYHPDFIIDVGASVGAWSAMVQRIFNKVRFILIDPLSERYLQWYHQQYPQFEWISAAVSNKNGKAVFQVSNRLLGSSLVHMRDDCSYQFQEVATTTLDTVLEQKMLRGRGLLRMNIHHAEHLLLEGASALLQQIDIIMLELSLRNTDQETQPFLEMVDQMKSIGFHYFDDAGGRRESIHGTLYQKNILFVSQRIITTIGGV